jgi:GNAT superfamily N-acetyltransferase
MLVRFAKNLRARPDLPACSRFRLRNYQGEDDVAVWLDIRRRALVGQIAAGRDWSESDFRREFLAKPWWRPESMWFVEESNTHGAIPLGAAALRLSDSPAVASIQWLLVVPEARRRGVGRQLVAAVEAAAWDAGCRMVVAETLEAWEGAVRFYESVGYRAR